MFERSNRKQISSSIRLQMTKIFARWDLLIRPFLINPPVILSHTTAV